MKLPLCSSSKAFQLLAKQLPLIHSSDALISSAVAIAMHEMDDVDPEGVDAALQGYADTVRARVKGSQPQAVLAHLHEVLFEEEGFAGNREDYYNAQNSYLPAVLQTKRGLPITLSLIYKSVAERLGLRAWGVSLPEHFVVGVEVGEATMLIDPFACGRVMSIDEVLERMVETFGADFEWTSELLQPVTHRYWLTRMLQNLLNIFGNERRYRDVAAVLEMEMLLWPQHGHLQRDLALVLARCGMPQVASEWLDRYLRSNPDDPQKGELQQLLEVLAA